MARKPNVFVLVLVAGVVAAAASVADGAGLGVRRRIASFDFESEKQTGQRIPRGWSKSGLPGPPPPPEARFPAYLEGRLSTDHAHDGLFSFRMDLNGGNLAYTFAEGVQANPDSDYLLVGWVRTADLQNARAQLRLLLTDGRGEPIDGAVSLSEPMGGPGDPSDGAWRRFEVFLKGDQPAAARVKITLSLVQPEIWRPPDQRAVAVGDIAGTCWWDDIVVYRLPRVDLRTTEPANVFAPPNRPGLKVRMEGLGFPGCSVILSVLDADGSARLRRLMEPPGPDDPVERDVPLPHLPAGLYTAELAISAAGEVLMRKTCTFATLAATPHLGRGGLTLDAAKLPPEQWPVLLAMANRIRVGAVKLPAWPPGSNAAGDSDVDRRMHNLLARLHESGTDVTLVLDDLPGDLAETPAANGALLEAAAAGDGDVAEAAAWLMTARAHRVRRWQLGADGDDELPWRDALPAAVRTGRGWVSKMIGRPDLQLAWPSDLACDVEPDARLSVTIDPALPAEQIPAQLAEFAGRRLEARLGRPAAPMSRLDRLSEFALRYGYARAAGVESIAIEPPWTVGANGRIEPTELLPVARTLTGYLGSATCLGVARLNETAVAVIFRRPDGEGVMLAYRRPDGEAREHAELDLPETAHGVDLWGRRWALPRRDGRCAVRLSTTPILIAGCDAESLALRGSLRLVPQVIESTYEPHRATVQFTNPYEQPVSGKVLLAAPAGWDVAPRVLSFALPPGGQWNAEVNLRFPYNAVSGMHALDVTLDVEALDRRTIRAPAFFYLGMEGVTFEPVSAIAADGALEVQVVVINHREEPIRFTCYAHLPDRARQSGVVDKLGPAAKAMKVFRFPDAAALIGQTLRTGLREIDGRGVLNHTSIVR